MRVVTCRLSTVFDRTRGLTAHMAASHLRNSVESKGAERGAAESDDGKMAALIRLQLLVVVASCAGLLGKATANTGAPALAWSPDAQLLGGQKGRYLDGLGPEGGMQALLGALEEKQDPKSASASPAFTLVVVSETLSRQEFLAPSLKWLANAFKNAASSVTVSSVEASDADKVSMPGVSVFKGDIAAQEDIFLSQFARKNPDSNTAIVKVASLADETTGKSRLPFAFQTRWCLHFVLSISSPLPHICLVVDLVWHVVVGRVIFGVTSTHPSPETLCNFLTFLNIAAAVERMASAIEAAHSGRVVFVVASQSSGPALDLDSVLSSSMSGRQSRRHMLSSLEAAAPVPKLYAVRNTPSIMAGTLIGFFLLFILSIAVSCLSGIDSSPMMMQNPPGPKDGDPQFNGTAREGTRYYPYRNQPFKEH